MEPDTSTGNASAVTRQVGVLTVTCLLDAAGPFTLNPTEEAFPDATAADWAAARAIDAGAFGTDGRWHLHFHCFAIQAPDGHVTVVDTGVGPDGSPASWAPLPGRLPQALLEIGVQPGDVDLVVQTHLHGDHLGWAVTPGGVPFFGAARYVVQRNEVSALERSGSPIVAHTLQPLRNSGQLDEISGRATLLGGHGRANHRVVAVPTPGHTPGHQSVLVEDGDERLVITGDVLVHAVQLVDPDVRYVHEDDPDTARTTRRELLAAARRDGSELAPAHLTAPFLTPGQW